MTSPDLSAVEQLPQPDPRGILALRYLPDDIQKLEDATADADKSRSITRYGRRLRPRAFERDATPTEKLLLEHLGYTLPAELQTTVSFVTTSVRNRRWVALEGTL